MKIQVRGLPDPILLTFSPFADPWLLKRKRQTNSNWNLILCSNKTSQQNKYLFGQYKQKYNTKNRHLTYRCCSAIIVNYSKKIMELCLECGRNISDNVFNFSVKKYGIPLCMEHQNWIDYMETETTFEVIRLYFALKKKGVPAQMEKFDGYKHIDIAIPEARVNIEVDGKHHNYSKKQALADLKRTYFSFIKGYFTLRIPNSLVYEECTLEETADFIVGILNESLNN
ncbi:hypothetical protein [Flexithrix dorotheae]|uniref:hypothetical protein n=1 Tax=Flexithrix dorotheae TaxID=70993 RepID=UPI0003A29467|nr:hypothetical protein [Flexithrix dorotheae]